MCILSSRLMQALLLAGVIIGLNVALRTVLPPVKGSALDAYHTDFEQLFVGDGWYLPEGEPLERFVWTRDATATLNLPPMTPDSDYVLTFYSKFAITPRMFDELELQFNGTTLIYERIPIEAGFLYSAPVAQSQINEPPRWNYLVFKTPPPINVQSVDPDSSDTRALGIALDWLHLGKRTDLLLYDFDIEHPGIGWQPPERSPDDDAYQWMSARQSILYLYEHPSGSDLTLMFEVYDTATETTVDALIVQAGFTPLTLERIDDERMIFRADVPAETANAAYPLTLIFVTGGFGDAEDGEPTGLALDWLAVYPANAPLPEPIQGRVSGAMNR